MGHGSNLKFCHTRKHHFQKQVQVNCPPILLFQIHDKTILYSKHMSKAPLSFLSFVLLSNTSPVKTAPIFTQYKATSFLPTHRTQFWWKASRLQAATHGNTWIVGPIGPIHDGTWSPRSPRAPQQILRFWFGIKWPYRAPQPVLI